MTAPVYTPASEGRVTMEEYGPGCFVTGGVILETRRALHLNPPGQLWEREAERDVQAHGEPDLTKPDRRKCEACERHPQLMRQHIATMIQFRRPSMRAAWRCPSCNGEGAVSVMDPFGHETLYDCGECDEGLVRPATRARRG